MCRDHLLASIIERGEDFWGEGVVTWRCYMVFGVNEKGISRYQKSIKTGTI